MLPSPKEICIFQHKVLDWFETNKRDLPWRKTKDPYAILLSEVMLQQTQVERVIPYYERWLKKWPDFKGLANAEQRDVLRHWSGLGYNNRAIRLHKLAKQLRGKELVYEEEKLLNLPGIGPYTARAILAFAHNESVPVIDTNIRRVLIHELGLPQTITNRDLERIAYKCIPEGKSRLWHNALMDYGALEQTARKTGIKAFSKQGKFEGSLRQCRGKIVKYLLEHKSLPRERCCDLSEDTQIPIAIDGLRRDGIIILRDDEFILR